MLARLIVALILAADVMLLLWGIGRLINNA